MSKWISVCVVLTDINGMSRSSSSLHKLEREDPGELSNEIGELIQFQIKYTTKGNATRATSLVVSHSIFTM